uniref:Uncharacterized protein n=1 Tax=Ditylenchus dipsaci TaxID=166011 RepID=A0A915EGJ4_9BILA
MLLPLHSHKTRSSADWNSLVCNLHISISSLPFSTTSSPFLFYLQFVLLLLDLVAIFLLFKAFYTNSHLLLLPFILIETLYTYNLTKLLVYSFFDPITTEKEENEEVGGRERHDDTTDEITVAKIMTAVGALTMTACAFICFWWTSVTISCYFYFRDLKVHEQNDKKTSIYRPPLPVTWHSTQPQQYTPVKTQFKDTSQNAVLKRSFDCTKLFRSNTGNYCVEIFI